ncbi:hypothetical protein RclHR1_05990016 [Rhizophagus clarus]|uniref:Uncharacterized protein n=1 Tax=Rhizophagus clarus TaxID=94130 RepID=A0A2Z6SH27_9GLOM|nr:hypothetical protein RclHR1_05990016 [Rhizophagus clarus]GES76146.1 hypothetical protein GLOIN_2v1476780 [Rhizophagus clarus]
MNRLFSSTEASKLALKQTQVDNKNDDDDDETSTKQEKKEKFKAMESVADDKLICKLDLSSNEDTEPSSPIDDDQSED